MNKFMFDLFVISRVLGTFDTGNMVYDCLKKLPLQSCAERIDRLDETP